MLTLRAEGEALHRVSEGEYHTRKLFDEQRSKILSEEKFEVHLQETRAEHAVIAIQILNRQLRSQDSEVCKRGLKYEVSLQE